VKDARLETIERRFDEPRLELGDTISLNDGLIGVVLARYTPAAHKEEVRYIVQVQADGEHGKGRR
jgi:hypothetical protein